MRRFCTYKSYKRLEYLSRRGIEVLLLTEHDLERLQDRTEKQGLYPYRPGFMERLIWSIGYIFRG